MPQAVKPNLLLYADDSVLDTKIKTMQKLKKIIYEDFKNICDFVVHW